MKAAASSDNPAPDSKYSAEHDGDGFAQFNGPGMVTSYGPGLVCHMKAQQQTMAALARSLGSPNGTGRVVIDKRSVPEKYDFTFQYDY